MSSLWHDDVRVAPPGWIWARTNDEAKVILQAGGIERISMDHDLGFSEVVIPEDPDEMIEVMQLRGHDEETGLHLAQWMCENDLIPSRIRIHSWNPSGAKAIAETFNHFGHNCEIRPFSADELKERSEHSNAA